MSALAKAADQPSQSKLKDLLRMMLRAAVVATSLLAQISRAQSGCTDLLSRLAEAEARVAELEAEKGGREEPNSGYLFLGNAFDEPLDIFWNEAGPGDRTYFGTVAPLETFRVLAFGGHRFEAVPSAQGQLSHPDPAAYSFVDAVAMPFGAAGAHHVFGIADGHSPGELLGSCRDTHSGEGGPGDGDPDSLVSLDCGQWRARGYCDAGSEFHAFMRGGCRRSCGLCGDGAAVVTQSWAAGGAGYGAEQYCLPGTGATAEANLGPPSGPGGSGAESCLPGSSASGPGGGTHERGVGGVEMAEHSGETSATEAPAMFLPDGRTLPARCRRDCSQEAAFGPGDLGRLFKGVVAGAAVGAGVAAEQVTVLSSDPWLLQIDDFASPQEVRWDAVRRTSHGEGTCCDKK